MRRRLLLALGGVAAFGLGIAVTLEPGLVRLHRLLVPAVGVLALLLAVAAVRARRRAALDRAETPDPELAQPLPVPGTDLEETLRTFSGHRHTSHLWSIRGGLRAAATAVVTQFGTDTRESARERLDRGTWTDDQVAAAFLQPTRTVGTLGSRLRARVAGESSHERRVRRTVDAIVELATLPDATPQGEDDEEPPYDASLDATVTPGPDIERETGHWQAVGALALVAVGVGTLLERPSVVLAATVGIGYAAYARAGSPPATELTVERDLTRNTDAPGASTGVDDLARRPDRRPATADAGPSADGGRRTGGEPDDGVNAEPGANVSVTVTVRNDGNRTLPDLRLVDGVPAALEVVEGAPRLATALRQGETATLAYTIEARRGVHEFGPTLALARDVTGAHEHECRLPAGGTVTCIPPLHGGGEPVPLREQATRYVGQVATASGGEGVEFHATREYRPGDSPSRLDWNRRARTGELSTVEYREERAATVVVVVDTRPAAHVSPAPDQPSAVDRCVDAAGSLSATLLDGGNRVGIAALGSNDLWLPPGSGRDHRARLRDVLATHSLFAPVPSGEADRGSRWLWLHRRLPGGAQVLLLSPLVDRYAAGAARWLDARNHPVSIVSPDATATDTPGRRLARVGREIRLADLRSIGVPVVDWPWNRPLAAALASAERGWLR